MTATKTLAAMAVAAALITVGCSGASQQERPDGAPAVTAAPDLSDHQAPPSRVVIDVDIKDGHVTPINQQVQATVDQPIIVRVNSDAADELHVHATPEHTFEVKPEDLQAFQFAVEVPGKVDVELHHLNRVVATITVQ